MSVVNDISSDNLAENLPNLKIEIENDVNQRMETDDDDSSSVKECSVSSEKEEGEVIDEDDELSFSINGKSNPPLNLSSQIVPTGRSILKYDTKEYIELQQQTASVKNPNGAFVTGLDIFSPEEQAKLDKRAQRFGIEATEAKVLTEKLLKKLYKSMCVKPTDKNVRTEALHMRGTEQMTTQDVFSYFKDYGPASLEWINDNSCNVVWLDDISAARALLGLSVHISGQTSPAVTHRRPSQSDSDVEMETQEAEDQTQDTDNLSEESDAVVMSDLGIDLPPGRWRKGAPHPLSPCILLRFATTADRSMPRPGYTKFGSHQFGGYVGLISESCRRRMLNTLPTPIMFDDVGDEIIPKPSVDEKDNSNPWGSLAKTWSQFDKVRKPRPPSPIIERILPLPPRMTPPPSPPIFSSRPKLVARRRPVKAISTHKVSDDSSDNEWCSRSKLPRMRMHADDEEKKLEKKRKRARRKRSLSHSPSRPVDLRKMLVIKGERTSHRSDGEDSSEPEPVVEVPEEDNEIPDLRVAVAAEGAGSPEDSKAGLRLNLFQSGNVKSVLRGARGQSVNDDEKSEEEDEEIRPSRRHRSRSKERRRHHRRHKRESHHKSRRRNSDSDSCERERKTLKSTIKRISPEKERKKSEREKRSPKYEERRRKREEAHKRTENSWKQERRNHEESRSGKDLRTRLHRHKEFDSYNEFRSKSPLQIEIDNDEYYRTVESD